VAHPSPIRPISDQHSLYHHTTHLYCHLFRSERLPEISFYQARSHKNDQKLCEIVWDRCRRSEFSRDCVCHMISYGWLTWLTSLRGGFHGTWERLTGKVFDDNGNQMYFYCADNQTFWDRIHFPRKTAVNRASWRNPPTYRVITEAQYIRCVPL